MTPRPAQPGDAAALLPIVNHVIRDTTVTFTNREKTESDMRDEIAARGSAFLVAEEAGHILGYASYAQFRGGPGYARTMEHSIALAPAARGHGVGRALIEAMCDQARGQGVHVMIGGISAENVTGLAFHGRLGFVETGRLPQVGFKFGRYIDLVFMQKFL
ncbi:GNAT family N-acetyltransferase [Lutimaribacter sp. EGI FJ00015]|uniref:GNAT family N-acetyltransferase n=1 Tax=Lutimaribacter degradans TaxID=2945989 RepID=A0ACC6A2K6_9RHOB|nr:GNAT family N-acetyltransferase [Lutimaribacter sp. EGI FJ00013]MCO0615026.1 GNAT family N-acetyltransferase [Lutimaribacter sp. EGI FJ00015]MCO0637690.1 GNAT family N-acetyltransferase [Lutimaribacter sp. EGI FJ00014]